MQFMRSQLESNNNVAIYCRLSQDDGNQGDSQSIQNQKQYLRNYCFEQGWKIFDIYVDDGYSGTNFNRPGFKQMISDIEAGFINIVITKDLSRLGRDYIMTGEYTERYFPNHNVRYIALNDNVDTANEDGNEFAPFKNIINEWYAKDISKKVRFTLNNQMKTGKQTKTCIPIYGYTFNNDNQRIPDKVTAPIVQRIFKRFLECYSCSLVAKELREDKIKLPGYYHYLKTGYKEEVYSNISESEKYNWTRQKVYRILTKEEYKGTYIRGKRKSRFKSFKSRVATEEELYYFEDAFEPLISKEDFEKVQILLTKKVNETSIQEFNPFRGIVKCAICGSNLRIHTDKTYNYVRLSCRNKEGNESPSIRLNTLMDAIKEDIRIMQKYVLSRKDEFLKLALKHSLNSGDSKTTIEKKKKITQLKRRLEDCKTEERSVFEDHHKGLINRETYISLLNSYSETIHDINEQIKSLEDEITKDKVSKNDYIANAERYIKILENFDFDLMKKPDSLSNIYEAIYIKCDPTSVRNKRRKVIMDTYVYGVNDILKEFLENVK